MKALSLFFPKEGVNPREQALRHAAARVREVLSKAPKQLLDYLMHEFDLTEDKLAGLKKKNGPIDFELFDGIKGALGLSWRDVLGKPDLSNGAREHWEQQCQESPMFFAAPIMDVEGDSERVALSDEERKELELELYVRLRAVDELAWDK